MYGPDAGCRCDFPHNALVRYSLSPLLICRAVGDPTTPGNRARPQPSRDRAGAAHLPQLAGKGKTRRRPKSSQKGKRLPGALASAWALKSADPWGSEPAGRDKEVVLRGDRLPVGRRLRLTRH
jgi:hypothetical protein